MFLDDGMQEQEKLVRELRERLFREEERLRRMRERDRMLNGEKNVWTLPERAKPVIFGA